MKHKIPGQVGTRFHAQVVLGLALTMLTLTAQASTLAQVEAAGQPMRSRVCGLVLLSEGRADARSAKALKDQQLTSTSFAKLTGAFALLADGRPADKKAAREAAYALLGTLQKPGAEKQSALSRCDAWLKWRVQQADFDKSEEARWSWAQQAKLTFDTE